MIEHVYRRASDARSVSSVIVATDDERIAARGSRLRRRRRHDLSRSSERHRPPRRSRRDARLRSHRQRPGGRTADRAGDDRRGGRAVRDDRGAADGNAAPPHRRSTRARESERHQGRRRSGRLRALLFARADPVHASGRRTGAGVAARRAVRLYPRLPADARRAAADATRAVRGARAAARARARHPDHGGRDALRLDRRGYAGRSRRARGIMAAAARCGQVRVHEHYHEHYQQLVGCWRVYHATC